MAGLPINKDIINQRAGFLILTLRETLADIGTMKTYLDGKTDAELVADGFSEDDVAVLKSAFGDVDKLRRVAHGQEIQAAPSDFFFWAKRLTGLE